MSRTQCEPRDRVATSGRNAGPSSCGCECQYLQDKYNEQHNDHGGLDRLTEIPCPGPYSFTKTWLTPSTLPVPS
jgi:hypothetical protein